jgi:hypothetical protein
MYRRGEGVLAHEEIKRKITNCLVNQAIYKTIILRVIKNNEMFREVKRWENNLLLSHHFSLRNDSLEYALSPSLNQILDEGDYFTYEKNCLCEMRARTTDKFDLGGGSY